MEEKNIENSTNQKKKRVAKSPEELLELAKQRAEKELQKIKKLEKQIEEKNMKERNKIILEELNISDVETLREFVKFCKEDEEKFKSFYETYELELPKK